MANFIAVHWRSLAVTITVFGCLAVFLYASLRMLGRGHR
jgi:hypothetical protein